MSEIFVLKLSGQQTMDFGGLFSYYEASTSSYDTKRGWEVTSRPTSLDTRRVFLRKIITKL